MATNAQLFLVKLKDSAFRSAFEKADSTGRELLLSQNGLFLSLKDAEAIFCDVTGEISEADLTNIAGGRGIISSSGYNDDEIP